LAGLGGLPLNKGLCSHATPMINILP
jgi:hypothetical protein